MDMFGAWILGVAIASATCAYVMYREELAQLTAEPSHVAINPKQADDAEC